MLIIRATLAQSQKCTRIEYRSAYGKCSTKFRRLIRRSVNSLECGGLAPLWPASGKLSTIAVQIGQSDQSAARPAHSRELTLPSRDIFVFMKLEPARARCLFRVVASR